MGFVKIPTVDEWHTFRDKTLKIKSAFGKKSITNPLKKFQAIATKDFSSPEQVKPLTELTQAIASYKAEMAKDAKYKGLVSKFSEFLETPVKNQIQMLEEMAHPIVKLKTGIDEMSANAKAFITTPTQEVFSKLLGAKQTINQAITVYCELEMVKENKAVHEFLNTNQKAISDLVESIAREKVLESPNKMQLAKAKGLALQQAMVKLYGDCKKSNILG
jgi:Fe2+ or Zn2+ uptake regulation protein